MTLKIKFFYIFKKINIRILKRNYNCGNDY